MGCMTRYYEFLSSININKSQPDNRAYHKTDKVDSSLEINEKCGGAHLIEVTYEIMFTS